MRVLKYLGSWGFYGHIDQRFDPHHGYHGPLPERWEQPFNGFRANAAHDEHGTRGNPGHDGAANAAPDLREEDGPTGGGHAGGHR